MVDSILIYTILLAILGSFTNVLLWIEKWSDVTSIKSIKTVVLGFIVGILYYILRVEHQFPDSIMAFIVGYSANDFLSFILEKFKLK